VKHGAEVQQCVADTHHERRNTRTCSTRSQRSAPCQCGLIRMILGHQRDAGQGCGTLKSHGSGQFSPGQSGLYTSQHPKIVAPRCNQPLKIEQFLSLWRCTSLAIVLREVSEAHPRSPNDRCEFFQFHWAAALCGQFGGRGRK